MDLFDPKPKLNELHGQPLPDSMTKTSGSPSSKRRRHARWAARASLPNMGNAA
ncbi:hypothetical protein [Prosthecobacter algae]|uniref:hypothetical protein n=1 Tax=Prosthecobacter algae TaxID=1144682 RepID=UPI0031E6CE22